jgi:hypothetical protein
MTSNEKTPTFAEDFSLEGQVGLEPTTFCLRGRRSNQLSYWPVVIAAGYTGTTH